MDLSILNQMEPRFLKDKEFLSSVIQSLNLTLDVKILDIGTGSGCIGVDVQGGFAAGINLYSLRGRWFIYHDAPAEHRYPPLDQTP